MCPVKGLLVGCVAADVTAPFVILFVQVKFFSMCVTLPDFVHVFTSFQALLSVQRVLLCISHDVCYSYRSECISNVSSGKMFDQSLLCNHTSRQQCLNANHSGI